MIRCQPIEFDQSESLKFLPEGPFPLGDDAFSWVAIQHGAESTTGSLNRMVRREGVWHNECTRLDGRPGFAFPTDREGVFVAGIERSLGFVDTFDGSFTPFCDTVDADVDNTIINDGIVHGDNLIFGTKDLQFENPKAGLYLYRGRDGQLVQLRNDQTISNGKAVIAGDAGSVQFLDIDSPTRRIVRYTLDIDAGQLSGAETVVELEDDGIVPDGAILTPDGEGVIVAVFRYGNMSAANYEGQTRWYDLSTRELKQTWVTPGSPQNTCPALVRIDGEIKLLITTAAENMDDSTRSNCHQAGRLFVGDCDFETLGGASRARFRSS